MDASAALLAGVAAGLVIAMQVGVVSLLVVETTLLAGTRAGVAAGMGVATADLLFASVAAAAGGVASEALARHETQIRLAGAACLAAIALHGLWAHRRRQASASVISPGGAGANEGRTYSRFIAITAVNPLTVVSFAAIATSLSLEGPPAAAAFAAGAGAGSAAWHSLLPLAAGRVGRWMSPAGRRRMAVGGRVAVLALAAHLALAA